MIIDDLFDCELLLLLCTTHGCVLPADRPPAVVVPPVGRRDLVVEEEEARTVVAARGQATRVAVRK
jgi:hypothetical protein